jgi:phenylalanyl-tRNA synthetase alpha chain
VIIREDPRLSVSQSEARLIDSLKKLGGKADGASLATDLQVPESSIFPLSNLLQGKGYVKAWEEAVEVFTLTEEGRYCLEKGLPEVRLVKFLTSRGGSVPLRDLSQVLKPQEVSAALGWGRRGGAMVVEKKGGDTFASLKGGHDTALQGALEKLASAGGARGSMQGTRPDQIKQLMERGLISSKVAKVIHIELIKEPPVATESAKLTSEMIKNGSWKGIRLRPYDVTASPPVLTIGKKHPYLEFLEEVKEILFSMGFEETAGPYVESEFWNFDALYQAQEHPARAVHDNFRVIGPRPQIDAPAKLINAVKKTHENGGDTGSTGWGYSWSLDIAKQPVLRTQTTAVSVRTLFQKREPPVKTFCLSKVFRPDSIDSRHMLEFDQLDGIIGDKGINVRHLLGTLSEFAQQLGFKDIKFTPGYFPFTEPSIEAYAKHPKLGWIECLGSGLFRPEVLTPLGIDFPVIAWGIGIGRLAMIRLGVDDIRDLHTMDLGKLREWGWR